MCSDRLICRRDRNDLGMRSQSMPLPNFARVQGHIVSLDFTVSTLDKQQSSAYVHAIRRQSHGERSHDDRVTKSTVDGSEFLDRIPQCCIESRTNYLRTSPSDRCFETDYLVKRQKRHRQRVSPCRHWLAKSYNIICVERRYLR